MKLKTISIALAVLVIIVVAIYGIDKKINPYRGLITHQDVQSEEGTVLQLQGQLDSSLAGIAASEEAGETPNLNLFIVAATNAYYLGDLVQAREIYEHYFEYNSINPTAWNNYGNILKEMHDYKKAEGAYMRAIELNADSEEYYSDLADLIAVGWPEGERDQDIKEIIEINVDISGQTRWNMVALGDWYLNHDDCERAADHYRVALALAKNETSSQDILSNIEADIESAKNACKEE